MAQKKSLARQIWDARWLYLLILPEYEKMVDPLVEEVNTTYCAN